MNTKQITRYDEYPWRDFEEDELVIVGICQTPSDGQYIERALTRHWCEAELECLCELLPTLPYPFGYDTLPISNQMGCYPPQFRR